MCYAVLYDEVGLAERKRRDIGKERWSNLSTQDT